MWSVVQRDGAIQHGPSTFAISHTLPMQLKLFVMTVLDSHKRVRLVSFALLKTNTKQMISAWLAGMKKEVPGWTPSCAFSDASVPQVQALE